MNFLFFIFSVYSIGLKEWNIKRRYSDEEYFLEALRKISGKIDAIECGDGLIKRFLDGEDLEMLNVLEICRKGVLNFKCGEDEEVSERFFRLWDVSVDMVLEGLLKTNEHLCVERMSFEGYRIIPVSKIIRFKNLSVLKLNGCALKDVSAFSALLSLKKLSLCEVSMQNGDFSKLKNLESLSLCFDRLSTINLKKMKNLKILRILHTQLKEIEIKNLQMLQDIKILGKHIKVIKIDSLMNLSSLYLHSLINIKSISLNNLINLNTLQIQKSIFEELDISNLYNLKELEIKDKIKINKLDISALHNLTKLNIEKSRIATLIIPRRRMLKEINLKYNTLNEIKLRGMCDGIEPFEELRRIEIRVNGINKNLILYEELLEQILGEDRVIADEIISKVECVIVKEEGIWMEE